MDELMVSDLRVKFQDDRDAVIEYLTTPLASRDEAEKVADLIQEHIRLDDEAYEEMLEEDRVEAENK